MRPQSSSAPRALMSLALGLALSAGACGGSTAAQPVEVNLGGEAKPSSDGEVKRSEKPDADIAPKPAKPAEPPAPEVAYLTIVCDPACDDIADEGRSLGPSPIIKVPVPPGSRRIMLTNAIAGVKTITVILKPGEISALRVQMDGKPTPFQVSSLPPTTSAAAASSLPPPPQPPADILAQRAQLEPKVWAGKATQDEIKLLRAICSLLADRACRDRATSMLKAQGQAPPSSSP